MEDIKDNGFVKLLQDGKASTLHYIKDEMKIYSLTQGSSNKVSKINEDNKVSLAFGKNIVDSSVNIVEDKILVKDLFDKLLNMNFTHYKNYSDDLVILEMSI